MAARRVELLVTRILFVDPEQGFVAIRAGRLEIFREPATAEFEKYLGSAEGSSKLRRAADIPLEDLAIGF